MRTAPRDGTYILLAYPSFSDNGMIYVGHGRWIECPHENEVNAYVASFYPCHADAPMPKVESHWEVAYVAISNHGGRHYQGDSYGPRSVVIRKPMGWMPVPRPPRRTIGARQ
jgi:hypothetical protein